MQEGPHAALWDAFQFQFLQLANLCTINSYIYHAVPHMAALAPDRAAIASALLAQSLRAWAARLWIRSSAAMANARSGVERPRAVLAMQHITSVLIMQIPCSAACYRRASSSVTPSGPAQLCATISLLSSAPTTTTRPHRGGWTHFNTGAYPSSIRPSSILTPP